MKFEWEDIKNLPSCKTYRAKVIGGWIINNLTLEDNKFISESMVFVPDAKHQWIIEDEK